MFILANQRLDDREGEVRKVIAHLENNMDNMEFLGITGVEDKLQEEVC